MIKCIIFLLLIVNIYAQDLSADVSDNIQPLLVEELSELELMLIANINTNETLQNFFKLDIIFQKNIIFPQIMGHGNHLMTQGTRALPPRP